MSALKYWIWMTNLGKIPGAHAFSILERFGTPEKAYIADDETCDRMGLPAGISCGIKNKSLEKAEEILADCQRLNLRILTYTDAGYPDRLRQIDDPPCVLYVKGRLPQIDDEIAIAMVGSRQATPYGQLLAHQISMEIARQGSVVISGVARGIDTASLKGALIGGGSVISVLGNGIDVVYPKENAELYDDIVAAGALISEYPPGTKPDGIHFPIRNRIISGLSLGVVVIEGNEHSGSLITARLALEQNRDVFAVPGNWNATQSRGPNLLIQRGEAKLIMGPWDILTEYRHSYPHRIQYKTPLEKAEPAKVVESNTTTVEAEKKDNLANKTACDETQENIIIDIAKEPGVITEEECLILKTVYLIPLTADEIIEATEIPTSRVMSTLTMLQVKQLVVETAGRRFYTKVIINT